MAATKRIGYESARLISLRIEGIIHSAFLLFKARKCCRGFVVESDGRLCIGETAKRRLLVSTSVQKTCRVKMAIQRSPEMQQAERRQLLRRRTAEANAFERDANCRLNISPFRMLFAHADESCCRRLGRSRTSKAVQSPFRLKNAAKATDVLSGAL